MTFDIASLDWSGLHLDDYTTGGVHPGPSGDNWPGTVSIGQSGDADRFAQTEGATNVVLGNLLNGHRAAKLVSTSLASAYMHNGNPATAKYSDYGTNDTFSFFYVVDPLPIIYDSAPALRYAYIMRTFSAYMGVRFIRNSLLTGQKAIALHAFYDGSHFVSAEIPYTVDAAHIPIIITGRLFGSMLQLGLNTEPGLLGGNSSVVFPGVIPAAGLNEVLNVSTFGGTGLTGDLYGYGLSKINKTDAAFRNTLDYLRWRYGRAFPGTSDTPAVVLYSIPKEETVAEFGTEISCVNDIDISGRIISDRMVIAESIARRLTTPRGRLIRYPLYGYDLTQWLNADVGPLDIAAMTGAVRAECMKEERVQSASVSIVFDAVGQTLTVDIDLETAIGPFSMTLVVSNVSVEKLTVT